MAQNYEFAPNKTLISFGTAVKALGDGKIAGYLVRYGDPANKDLTGEYFTPYTDFGEFDKADVYYQHGADKKLGKRKLAKGTLVKDKLGVWIEAKLDLIDQYQSAIYTLAQRSLLGWSSGTLGHLVEKAPDGRITAWPLGLDASLTPTPAEPRNSVIPLKNYLDNLQGKTNRGGTVIDISQAQINQLVEEATVVATKTAVEMILKARARVPVALTKSEVELWLAEQERLANEFQAKLRSRQR